MHVRAARRLRCVRSRRRPAGEPGGARLRHSWLVRVRVRVRVHVSTEGDGEARPVRRVGRGVVLQPRGEENEEARQRRDAHVLAYAARPTRRHGHHACLRSRVDQPQPAWSGLG